MSAQDIQSLQEDLNQFEYQLRLEPDNPDVNYNIAQVYFRMNKIDLAIRYLERTLYLSSDDAQAITRLATLYWKIGKLACARDLLQKAIKMTPQDSETWYGFGIVLSDLADYPGALAAFEKAWQLSPDPEQKNLILYYTGLVHLSNRDFVGYQSTLERLKTVHVYFDPLKKMGSFWENAGSDNQSGIIAALKKALQ